MKRTRRTAKETALQKQTDIPTQPKSMEEQLEGGKIFELENYTLSKESLTATKYAKDGSEYDVIISPPLYIDKRYQSIHTNEVDMVLKLKVDGRYITEKAPMKTLTSLPSFLAAKGLPIYANYVRDVQGYLVLQQKEATMFPQYDHIGFIEDKQGNLFVGLSEAVGHPNPDIRPNHNKLPADVSTKGTLDEWKALVREDVLGVIPLEFILGAAASSLLIGYYGKTGQDNDSLLIQLLGTSTTGKTTAAQLALSLFGPPIKGPKKLFQSFSSTANALPRMLGNNFGVPFLIDELSLASTKDLTDFVYLLAENREKGRMTEHLEMAEQLQWHTTILMTGEHAITTQTNKNLGLLVRLFEFEIPQWTTSAEHADRIKQTVKQQYGHSGLVYADYLMNHLSDIQPLVEKWTQHFITHMQVSDVRNRIAVKYGMIVAALELLGVALDLPFHLEDVAKFILQNEKRLQKNRDIAMSVYRDLIDDVIQNAQYFHVNHQLTRTFSLKGHIQNNGDGTCTVNYLKQEFKAFLTKNDYQNESTIMHALKKKSFFKHEQGRVTTRKMIAGNRLTTYEFIVSTKQLKQWIKHL